MVLLDELEFSSYPERNYQSEDKYDKEDEEYSLKLAKYMEFLELSKIIPEADRPAYIEKKFNMNFLHQETIRRLMINNDAILIIHPPGKGKTCTAVGIPEYISTYGTNVNKRANFPKRTYILERGPSVINDVKNQIINVCTKDKYLLDIQGSSTKGEKRKITNILNEKGRYTIQTYKDFSSLSLSDKLIKKIYSDSIFIIDEAHNINSWDDVGPEGEEDSGPEIMNKKDIIATYKYLHRVLHIAERIKIVIMTATPMTNSANEIIKLLNLVLPMNKQIDTNVNIVDMNSSVFKWYTEGLVSYLPDTTGKITVKEIGEILPGSDTVVLSLPMKGKQAEAYQNINLSIDKTGTFYINYRIVSGFVYPDGSYGGKENNSSKGLYKYVTRPNIDTYIPKTMLVEELRKNLGEYSATFDYMVKKELNPDRTIVLPDGYSVTIPGKGCSYFYFDLVVAHAIPFTMALESYGFERYNDAISPFHTFGNTTTLNMTKKPRYIFVTKDNVSTKLENFKNLFNSRENVFGEYVQIFIGSKIIRDGINIYNVSRLYLYPGWNDANMVQAMARAKRLVGHDKVIEETKKIMKNKGVPQYLIDDWSFVLEQHKMSAYLPGKYNILDVKSSINNYFFVEIIEKKNRDINIVMDRLIDVSVDKYINGIVKIPFESIQNQIKYGNFNRLYAQNAINEIKDIIISLFRMKRYFFVIDELVDIIFSRISPLLMNKDYILRALNEITSERIIINDDYGNVTWLHYVDRYVFISTLYPDVTSTSDIQNLFYRRDIIVQHDNIQKYVRRYCEENVKDILDIPYNQNTPTSNSVIAEYLINEEFKLRPSLASSKEWWNIDNEQLNMLLRNLLKSVLIATFKPYFDIKVLTQKLSLMIGHEGLKIGDKDKINIKNMVFSPEITNRFVKIGDKDVELPLILVHKIDDHGLRIFDVSKKAWEYATNYESVVYDHIYKLRQIEKMSNFKIGDVYGFVELNGDFFINKVTAIEINDMSTDKRLQLKGVACNNYNKEDLLKVLADEGVDVGGLVDLHKKDLCEMLKDVLEEKSKLIYN